MPSSFTYCLRANAVTDTKGPQLGAQTGRKEERRYSTTVHGGNGLSYHGNSVRGIRNNRDKNLGPGSEKIQDDKTSVDPPIPGIFNELSGHRQAGSSLCLQSAGWCFYSLGKGTSSPGTSISLHVICK